MKDFLQELVGVVCLVCGIILIAKWVDNDCARWMPILSGLLIGTSYRLAWGKH